jgi:hypothetical protein
MISPATTLARRAREEHPLSDLASVDGCAWILLSRGCVALVDVSDFEFCNRWIWSISDRGYAYRRESDNSVVYLHRVLAGASGGEHVDHINGIRLDNRRSNLRTGSHADNIRNQRKHRRKLPMSSTFKGVSRHKVSGLWRARGKLNYVEHRIGYFATEVEAAIAYDKWARENFGAFARPNFS